jgi:hypothetical protein
MMLFGGVSLANRTRIIAEPGGKNEAKDVECGGLGMRM